MNYHKVFNGPDGNSWTVSFETTDGGENFWPHVSGPKKKKISLMMSENDVVNTLISLQDLKENQSVSFPLFCEIVAGAALLNMKGSGIEKISSVFIVPRQKCKTRA